VGCDHNGDLKSSTTAQNENQDERAYQRNDQGTDAPEAVGEECEHYPSGLAYWYGVWPLHQIVFAGMLRGLARAAGKKV
jgi:hypothetical protein